MRTSLSQMGKQFHAGAIKLEPGLFFWFQFWILPERPLLHPLDKRNGGSGDEIGYFEELDEGVQMSVAGSCQLKFGPFDSCQFNFRLFVSCQLNFY